MQRPLIAALTCAALLALGACGSDDAASSNGDGTNDATELSSFLSGQTFLSSSVDGHTLADDTQIQLSFERDALTASAGCNQLRASMSIDGGILVVGDMMQTEMGCEQDLMEQDTWLGSFLQARPTLSLDVDTLSMATADATVVLVDRRIADPDLALMGTTWVVDGLIDGDAVSSIPQNTEASILITDGTATVRTGCNTSRATVEIRDNTITFAPMPNTAMACEPDAMRLEAAVTSVLRGDVTYTVEAGRLTLLTMDDGATLGLTLIAS